VVAVTGLKYTDVRIGDGRTAIPGTYIDVLYVGRLKSNGEVFDYKDNPSNSFAVKLGAGKVIRGWDEGIVGMKAGGRRTLEIPPDMGYGARGSGEKIPPNSTLIFDIELLRVR
jgi:FKBP-type peptidyl-prolyl cis-trans isomerase